MVKESNVNDNDLKNITVKCRANGTFMYKSIVIMIYHITFNYNYNKIYNYINTYYLTLIDEFIRQK